MTLRVLMLHARYREQGGEDVSVALSVKALQEAGVHVTPLFLPAWGEEPWRPYRAKQHLEGALMRGAYDIVHIQNFFPSASVALHRCVIQHKIPIIQHIRNTRMVCPAARLWRQGRVCGDCVSSPWPGIIRGCWRNSRVLTWMSSYSVRWQMDVWRRIACFIFPSAFLRTTVAPVLGGMPSAIVPNHACSLPRYVFSQGARSGLVYAGRLVPEKGVHILLQALEWLDPCIPITIYGSGPLEDVVRRYGKRVRFLGQVSSDEITCAMEKAQVVIVPSLWPEPFGRSALEGLAAGAMVVASAVGGLPEVVGLCGFLVPPGDPRALAEAIIQALSMPDEARRYMQARAHAIHQRATHGLLNTYFQYLEKRSRQVSITK